LCARNCKAACIDSKAHSIDYSRCVTCFDCIDKCHQGAISYTRRRAAVPAADKPADSSRRRFLAVSATVAVTAATKAQEKITDGGLAAITDKKIPERKTRIVPPGAKSIRHLTSHCTACQLCVSVCPNGVLRPSSGLATLMQPESSYERGYCRPECTRCSEVCPSGAISPITAAEKSAIQIGHAVWIKENCLPLTDGVACGNCARHCPAGAITMVPSDADNENSPKIPVVDTERCIGCGACENLCPSRPFSAIYVEGHALHRNI
ncbi:MAG: 4Fe-4S dicluster domain-containing protein, partial [Muribaculaceae bacterium]|nr:4Fe-4S dicluster domain-containing protein [Muribaculaceae bacterium]